MTTINFKKWRQGKNYSQTYYFNITTMIICLTFYSAIIHLYFWLFQQNLSTMKTEYKKLIILWTMYILFYALYNLLFWVWCQGKCTTDIFPSCKVSYLNIMWYLNPGDAARNRTVIFIFPPLPIFFCYDNYLC